MDEPTRAAILAAVCRSGLRHFFPGKRVFVFGRGDLARSKYYPRLVATAAALIEHDLSPAVWVAHAVAKWLHDDRRRKQPTPVTAILTPDAVAAQHGWARDNADLRLGGLRYGDEQRKLAAQWVACDNAYWLRLRGYPDAQVDDPAFRARVRAQVSAEHFPGDTWPRLLAVARAEAARIQADLDARFEAGEWLW